MQTFLVILAYCMFLGVGFFYAIGLLLELIEIAVETMEERLSRRRSPSPQDKDERRSEESK